MKMLVLAAVLTAMSSLTAFERTSDGVRIPHVGVDTAGTWFGRNGAYGGAGWEYPAFRDALKELGIDLLIDHYLEIPEGDDAEANAQKMHESILTLERYLEAAGIDYWWNLEIANWRPAIFYVPGQNLLDYNGAHFLMLPPDICGWMEESPRIHGVVYDELEHMVLSRTFSTNRAQNAESPAIVETDGLKLDEAYETLYEELQFIRQNYGSDKLGCAVEMVWPVMPHIFARAGWTLSPKLMKEGWTPVPVAMSLGAAVEYEHNGANFWLTPDLWFCGHYPGHGVEELRSALVAAHWLCAESIYVENLDYVHLARAIHDPKAARKVGLEGRPQGKHHPDAEGLAGSLVSFTSDTEYSLTAYGDVLRQYAGAYRWEHPRPYRWRDARCTVAIVRFPDSNWGQENSFMPKTLLGSKTETSTPQTQAWYQIWNVLSLGTIPPTGLSFHCRDVKGKIPPRFFVPTPPVLVFDHRVGDEHPDFDFRGAGLIYLTGVAVTPATLEAVSKAVEQGAVCITLPHLAPDELRSAYGNQDLTSWAAPQGKGRWLLTDRFDRPEAVALAEPFLPERDEMQYRFGSTEVVFRRVTGDQIQVLVDGKVVHEPPVDAAHRNIQWVDGVLQVAE